MTDKLVEYVIELNSSPEALEKHNQDCEQAARDFGLDENDVQLMKEQNVNEIKKRCAACSEDTEKHIVSFFKPE